MGPAGDCSGDRAGLSPRQGAGSQRHSSKGSPSPSGTTGHDVSPPRASSPHCSAPPATPHHLRALRLPREQPDSNQKEIMEGKMAHEFSYLFYWALNGFLLVNKPACPHLYNMMAAIPKQEARAAVLPYRWAGRCESKALLLAAAPSTEQLQIPLNPTAI